MNNGIDTSLLTPCETMQGEDTEESELLKGMLSRAIKYLNHFDWCPSIKESFLGFGVGGVIALFLMRFEEKIDGTDEWLWVVEGDVPSAYFVIDDATTPALALDVYCSLMQDWANAVLSQKPIEDLFPVNVPPTHEHAEMLLTRIDFIRKNLISQT